MKLLTLSILFVLNSMAWSKGLNIGYVEFFPYIYSNNSELQGPIVDYAKNLFKDFEISWTHTPILRVDRSLDNGSIDIFISYFKTAQRETKVDFSDQPYYDLVPGICSTKAPLAKNLKDVITDKFNRILHIQGTINLKKLTHPKVSIVEIPFKNYEATSILFLEKNRVDYVYYGDYQTALEVISKSSEKINCREYPEVRNSLYIVLKKNNPFKKIVNKKIESHPKMKF